MEVASTALLSRGSHPVSQNIDSVRGGKIKTTGLIRNMQKSLKGQQPVSQKSNVVKEAGHRSEATGGGAGPSRPADQSQDLTNPSSQRTQSKKALSKQAG